jgi:hypothetical protein
MAELKAKKPQSGCLQSHIGVPGESAYQIAVDHGYEGTEEEWLSEMKDYSKLNNKPQINSHTLSGNKSSDDLGLQKKLTAGENITIESNGTISASGGVTSYNDLTGKPIIQMQSVDGRVNSATIENIIKMFPFYMDSLTGYIHVDDSKYYKTDGISQYSATDFDTLLYDAFINNSVRLYGINPEGIPQSINAKDNAFIIYQFGVHNSFSAQLILWVDNITDESKIAYRICRYNHNTYHYDITDFIELGSGSQIVSGVVNQNGSITFTDSDGNTFTTSGSSVIGPDGFSPTVQTEPITDGTKVTITDKDGAHVFDVMNGQDWTPTEQELNDIAQRALGYLPNADTEEF